MNNNLLVEEKSLQSHTQKVIKKSNHRTGVENLKS